MCDLHYTAHYNWSWVVKLSIELLKQNQNSIRNLIYCDKFSELPSTKYHKIKATYSLFRIDLVSYYDLDNNIMNDFENHQNIIHKIRTRSDIFGFLDPKDSLYRSLLTVNKAELCMPKTLLIPWNWEDISVNNDHMDYNLNDLQIFKVRNNIINHLSKGPGILKAPLGSGGFGLYFVYNVNDVYEVIKSHRLKACTHNGFMEDLSNTFYGTSSVLSWSLQELIQSVRVKSLLDGSDQYRRCQVRAYVILCNDCLYLYQNYEVRLPSWDIDLDQTLADEYDQSKQHQQQHTTSSLELKNGITNKLWMNSLENEYCGNGFARPYNEHRNKLSTERYILNEIKELHGSEVSIHNCMLDLLTGLYPTIQNKLKFSTSIPIGSAHIHINDDSLARHIDDSINNIVSNHTSSNETQIAIMGVDLLVTSKHNSTATTLVSDRDNYSVNEDDFISYVVEVNNNPAMPMEEKNMSDGYKNHLVNFVSNILELSMLSFDNKSEDCLQYHFELINTIS